MILQQFVPDKKGGKIRKTKEWARGRGRERGREREKKLHANMKLIISFINTG
jgi:hypothetical protein